MQFFIIFIFGAVVLGAGSMLSPAWQTRQPRIGLAAALSTSLVLGGAVFWSEAFGWDTLVIDYLLFALVSGVVLGGTLSQAQTRAEAAGFELADADQGWPGPKDLAFFTLAGLLVVVPLLVIVLPTSDYASADAYLAMSAKLGNTFDTLMPFQPEAEVLYAPGFHALSAYLSLQLNQPIPVIQFSVAAVMALVIIWLAYDLGGEILDKLLGRAMAVALLGGLGLAGMYLNGYFVLLTALVFAFAFVIYTVRLLRHGHWADMVAGGLMLGATLYASPTMTFIVLMGYIPWLGAMWLPDADSTRPTRRTFLQLALGVPLVAIIGTSPWLLNNASQFNAIIGTEFYVPSFAYLQEAILYHGVVIVGLAGVGAYAVLSRRITWHQEAQQVVLLAVVWLVIIADAIFIGIIPNLLGIRALDARLLAWFAPIIPYTMLGGIALLWGWEQVQGDLRQRINNNAYLFLGGAALLAGLAILIGGRWFTSDITRDDVEALRLVQRDTPTESIILNVADDTWVASIAERDTVYLPPLPVLGAIPERISQRAEAFEQIWTSATPAELLAEYGITHVYQSGKTDQLLNQWVDHGTLEVLYQVGQAIVYQVNTP